MHFCISKKFSLIRAILNVADSADSNAVDESREPVNAGGVFSSLASDASLSDSREGEVNKEQQNNNNKRESKEIACGRIPTPAFLCLWKAPPPTQHTCMRTHTCEEKCYVLSLSSP